MPCKPAYVRRIALLAACLFLAAGTPACQRQGTIGSWTGQGTLVIEGPTIFTSPGVEPIQDGIVIVMDGVVEGVGARGELPVPPADFWIDGSGLSLLAGFWNAHVRMDAELLYAAVSATGPELEELVRERFSRFGFTSVVDTNTPWDGLAPLIERIQSGEVMGPRIVSVPGGAMGGVMFANPSSPPWSSGVLARFAVEDLAVVPGLGLHLDNMAPGAAGSEEQLSALRGFIDRGGSIVFGTGAGYIPQYDPMLDHLLLDEGGIPFPDHLASLTTEPALRFAYDYLGQVAPGMVADLVLLDGDPEVDVTAFNRVRLVLREGRALFW